MKNTEISPYKKSQKIQKHNFSLPEDPFSKPKGKVKLSPLIPDVFSHHKNQITYTQGKKYTHSSLSKILEKNSNEYEQAIKDVLQSRLISRGSVDKEENPLTKFVTKSPKCFNSKGSSKDLPVTESIINKKIVDLSLPRFENISQRNTDKADYANSFDRGSHRKYSGSIVDMRLFLGRIKNA